MEEHDRRKLVAAQAPCQTPDSSDAFSELAALVAPHLDGGRIQSCKLVRWIKRRVGKVVVELQATHQPSSTLTISYDLLPRVVEYTSISEHLASLRHGNKVAKRSNTVLPWHRGLLPLSSINCTLVSDAYYLVPITWDNI